jgi:hypothetical protein
MLLSIGATEDAAWRRSAAAGSDGFIAGWGTYSPLSSEGVQYGDDDLVQDDQDEDGDDRRKVERS